MNIGQIFFVMHFIWPRPAPHKCQGESKQPPCHCCSKSCLWNCFDTWPGTQMLCFTASASPFTYMVEGDLIIRSSWKNSNKTTFANVVLWHFSACLRKIRSARTLLLCGQCLAPDNRVFVMERERDKTLGASAWRLWPQASRLSGAESCEGHSWGSLTYVLKIFVGFFMGRAWCQKLKLPVLA